MECLDTTECLGGEGQILILTPGKSTQNARLRSARFRIVGGKRVLKYYALPMAMSRYASSECMITVKLVKSLYATNSLSATSI
jgi:hypothetical protein